MTRHLTRDELIDSLDGPLPAARQAHVSTCDTCRAERAQLASLLRDVTAVDIPEPSPLFWDHLSARIRERLANEVPEPARGGLPDLWRAGAWPRFALAAAVLAICVGIGWTGWMELRGKRFPGRSGATMTQEAHATPDASPSAGAAAGATDIADASDPSGLTLPGGADLNDHEWALMMRMAEEVAWEDGDGPSMDVRPATVERALAELTSEERRALAQLVQADIARPPS